MEALYKVLGVGHVIIQQCLLLSAMHPLCFVRRERRVLENEGKERLRYALHVWIFPPSLGGQMPARPSLNSPTSNLYSNMNHLPGLETSEVVR